MRVLLALVLLIGSTSCFAEKYTVIPVDDAQRLELFLRDDTGAPFYRLERLSAWLQARNKHLRFAMNAGMFEPDFSPVWPNGVFVVTSAGPRIVESSKYAEKAADVLLATQSGPLLVEHGVIHRRLSATSKYIRNGVGVTGTQAIFVISNVPVSLYELATYFRDELHCEDALYFDGNVSALYAPDLGRSDSTVDLGPIIGVSQ